MFHQCILLTNDGSERFKWQFTILYYTFIIYCFPVCNWRTDLYLQTQNYTNCVHPDLFFLGIQHELLPQFFALVNSFVAIALLHIWNQNFLAKWCSSVYYYQTSLGLGWSQIDHTDFTHLMLHQNVIKAWFWHPRFSGERLKNTFFILRVAETNQCPPSAKSPVFASIPVCIAFHHRKSTVWLTQCRPHLIFSLRCCIWSPLCSADFCTVTVWSVSLASAWKNDFCNSAFWGGIEAHCSLSCITEWTVITSEYIPEPKVNRILQNSLLTPDKGFEM